MADDVQSAAQAQQVLGSIGARALETNRNRVVQLTRLAAVGTRGRLSEVDRQRAVDIAHQLTGSAGTFGYPRVSSVARRLELFFAEGDRDATEHETALGWLAEIGRDLGRGPDEADELG